MFRKKCTAYDELKRYMEWQRHLIEALLAKLNIPSPEEMKYEEEVPEIEVDEEVLNGNKEVYGE